MREDIRPIAAVALATIQLYGWSWRRSGQTTRVPVGLCKKWIKSSRLRLSLGRPYSEVGLDRSSRNSVSKNVEHQEHYAPYCLRSLTSSHNGLSCELSLYDKHGGSYTGMLLPVSVGGNEASLNMTNISFYLHHLIGREKTVCCAKYTT